MRHMIRSCSASCFRSASRLWGCSSINRTMSCGALQTHVDSRYNGPLSFKTWFSSSRLAQHGHLHKPKPGEELHVTFILKDGTQKKYEVCEGETLLDIAQGHNLDMEGACGGSCACSTCHVIVDPEYYDALPEPDDDENDMLDLAYGLTETSRLGCQIKMSKDIDGIRVALPAMTRNVNASDFN